jgi:hypothetical protein
MQTIFLEVRDDIKDIVLSFLRILPNDAIKIHEYGEDDFTAEDEAAYQQAMLEKKSGQSIPLEKLKEKYGI